MIAEDDLSDVVIVEPVPIRYGFGPKGEGEGDDDGFVHGSDILFTMKDSPYGAPWTSQKLAQFMDALMEGWEAVHETRYARRDCANLDKLIDQVREVLASGESMIDVPIALSVEHDDVMHALSRSHPAFYTVWGDLDWLHFESLIEGPGPFNATELAKEVGLALGGSTRWAMERLVHLYGKPTIRRQNRPLDAIGEVLMPLVRDGVASPDRCRAELARAGLPTTMTKQGLRNRVRGLEGRLGMYPR